MRAHAAFGAFLAVTFLLSGCKTPEQRIADQAAADDATCKSYGLQFGTQQYAECRMRLTDQRQAAQAAADAALLQTLGQIQQNYETRATANASAGRRAPGSVSAPQRIAAPQKPTQPAPAGRVWVYDKNCLLYTSPSPRDGLLSRMPSSA